MSAHADQSELLDWLNKLNKNVKKVFINHGEPQPAEALRTKITDKYGWTCEVAKMNFEYILTE